MSSVIAHFTIALNDLDRTDLPLAGGKGANLGAMIHAGLLVPPGFCVTAETYRSAVYGLAPWIGSRIAGIDSSDGTALEQASQEIRAAIEREPLDESLLDALRAAYAELCAVAGDPQLPVAVRSSATAEDLPESSFAGQQDTLLNVRGFDALLAAVRRCWSSLWTPRAIVYRQRNGFAHDSVALAVVVQQMIEAEVAGVLFTADPVSGNRARMVVNGAWGLGEAVVSGLVSPDGWLLDRAGAVLEQELGAKERMVVYDRAGGTVERVTPAELRDQPCLTLAELRRLAELGRAAEQFFGSPQDLEWALQRGRLYLLQSRPITTLFPLPTPRPADESFRVYFSFNALQGIIEPLTPLGIDLFREIGRVVQAGGGLPVFPPHDTPRLVEAADRLYIDVTALLRHPIGRQLIQLPFRLIDPTSARLFPQLLRDPRLALGPLDRRATLRTVGRTLWRGRFMLRRLVFAAARPDRAREQAIARAAERIDRLEQLLERPMSLEEQHGMVRVMLVSAIGVLIPYLSPTLAPAMLSAYLLERLAQRWELPAGLVVAIRQGLPYNPTTAMDLALWQLSQTIKADRESRARFAASNEVLVEAYSAGRLPPVAQQGLAAFLARYGHRGVREIDVGVPRWSETPGYIINTIRNYLLLDDPALAPDRRFTALERAAETARAELIRLAAQQQGGLYKAALLRLLTDRVRRLMGVREMPKFWMVRMLALVRRLALGMGAELVQRGLLDHASDVSFLRLDELTLPADVEPSLRSRVAERRVSYSREMQRQHLPRVLTSEGELVAERPVSDEPGQLSGVGVSPGVYQGRVRIIRDPHGAHLEPGEILVAPSTDPAWTPLFLTAGGLIMEAGGTLSHGSVVAREYGIPAVVGVAGATTRLTTGAQVRIDGTHGTIALLEPLLEDAD